MKVKLRRTFNFRLIKDCNGNTIGELTYVVGGILDKMLIRGGDKAKLHTETNINIPDSMQVVAKEKPGIGYDIVIMPKEN